MIKLWKDKIVAQLPFQYRDEILENIPDAVFRTVARPDGEQIKYWEFPQSPVVAYYLKAMVLDTIPTCDGVSELAQALADAMRIKNGDDGLGPIPNIQEVNHETGEPLDPWPHQVRAYWWGLKLPGFLLGFDMGTGKSLVSVGVVSNVENTSNLIVCPKSVMAVWPVQFGHTKVEFDIYCPDGKASIQKRTDAMADAMSLAKARNRPFVGIINYDSFWRDPMRAFLLAQSWNVMIMDESHRIKGYNGKASKFAWTLSKRVHKRIGMTGTPLPHSLLDGFAQFRAIDPGLFGTHYHKHKMKYVILGGFGGKEVVDYQNVETFRNRFQHLTFQVPKSVLNLPPFVTNFRTCELDAKTRQVYRKLDKELFAEIEAGTITPANAMVKVLRLQQLTGGNLKLDDGRLEQYGTEKRDLLRDLLQDIPAEEPIIVFARFTADIKNIREALYDAGRTVGELSGGKNDLAKWQGGGLNSLAVQIRSGGVGINLIRGRYCIYYSVGHALGDYLQSLDRTHRGGQKRTVYYYHLLAEKTIDIKIYKALMERRNVISYLLGRELSPEEKASMQVSVE